VRAIIVFMCVKNVRACNKLHHGKVLVAVMMSPSYFVTASLIGYLNMTHFIHHSTRGQLSCFDICCWYGWQWSRMSELHVAITLPLFASHVLNQWCMKCVIFRYQIEIKNKYRQWHGYLSLIDETVIFQLWQNDCSTHKAMVYRGWSKRPI
jgi:hypothetical protein